MPTHALVQNGNTDIVVAVYSHSVVLTDAEIKGLPNTPIQLLAAPGVGKMIIPIRSFGVIDVRAGVYTNLGDTNAMQIGITLGIGTYIAARTNQGWAFGDNTKKWAFFNDPLYWIDASFISNQVISDGGYDTADVENKALMFKIDSSIGQDFIGGNAANTLSITVLYSIVDL